MLGIILGMVLASLGGCVIIPYDGGGHYGHGGYRGRGDYYGYGGYRGDYYGYRR